nr:uncharacterized protein LOC107457197 isoform X2 [Parasteatoda tepidariorum]
MATIITESLFGPSNRRRCVKGRASYIESVDNLLSCEQTKFDTYDYHEDNEKVNYPEIFEPEEVEEEPVTIDLSAFLQDIPLLTETTPENAVDSTADDSHSQFRVTTSLIDSTPALPDNTTLKTLDSYDNTSGAPAVHAAGDPPLPILDMNLAEVPLNIGSPTKIKENVFSPNKISPKKYIKPKSPLGFSNPLKKYRNFSKGKDFVKNHIKVFGKYPVIKCEKLDIENFVKMNNIKVSNWPLSHVKTPKKSGISPGVKRVRAKPISRIPKVKKPVSGSKSLPTNASGILVSALHPKTIPSNGFETGNKNMPLFLNRVSDNLSDVTHSVIKQNFNGNERLIRIVGPHFSSPQKSTLFPIKQQSLGAQNYKLPLVTSINRFKDVSNNNRCKMFQIIAPKQYVSPVTLKSVNNTVSPHIYSKPKQDSASSLVKSKNFTLVEPHIKYSKTSIKPNVINEPFDIMSDNFCSPKIKSPSKYQKDFKVQETEKSFVTPSKTVHNSLEKIRNEPILQDTEIENPSTGKSQDNDEQNLDYDLSNQNTELQKTKERESVSSADLIMDVMAKAFKTQAKKSLRSKPSNIKGDQQSTSVSLVPKTEICKAYNSTLNDILFGFDDDDFSEDACVDVTHIEPTESHLAEALNTPTNAQVLNDEHNEPNKVIKYKYKRKQNKQPSLVSVSNSKKDIKIISSTVAEISDDMTHKLVDKDIIKCNKILETNDLSSTVNVDALNQETDVLLNVSASNPDVRRRKTSMKDTDSSPCLDQTNDMHNNTSLNIEKAETLTASPVGSLRSRQLRHTGRLLKTPEKTVPEQNQDFNTEYGSLIKIIEDLPSPSMTPSCKRRQSGRLLRTPEKSDTEVNFNTEDGNLIKMVESLSSPSSCKRRQSGRLLQTPEKSDTEVIENKSPNLPAPNNKRRKYFAHSFKNKAKRNFLSVKSLKGKKKISKPIDIIQEIKTITGGKLKRKGKQAKSISLEKTLVTETPSNLINKSKMKSTCKNKRKRIKTLKVLFKKPNSKSNENSLNESDLNCCDSKNENCDQSNNKTLTSTFRTKVVDKMGTPNEDGFEHDTSSTSLHQKEVDSEIENSNHLENDFPGTQLDHSNSGDSLINASLTISPKANSLDELLLNDSEKLTDPIAKIVEPNAVNASNNSDEFELNAQSSSINNEESCLNQTHDVQVNDDSKLSADNLVGDISSVEGNENKNIVSQSINLSDIGSECPETFNITEKKINVGDEILDNEIKSGRKFFDICENSMSSYKSEGTLVTVSNTCEDKLISSILSDIVSNVRGDSDASLGISNKNCDIKLNSSNEVYSDIQIDCSSKIDSNIQLKISDDKINNIEQDPSNVNDDNNRHQVSSVETNSDIQIDSVEFDSNVHLNSYDEVNNDIRLDSSDKINSDSQLNSSSKISADMDSDSFDKNNDIQVDLSDKNNAVLPLNLDDGNSMEDLGNQILQEELDLSGNKCCQNTAATEKNENLNLTNSCETILDESNSSETKKKRGRKKSVTNLTSKKKTCPKVKLTVAKNLNSSAKKGSIKWYFSERKCSTDSIPDASDLLNSFEDSSNQKDSVTITCATKTPANSSTVNVDTTEDNSDVSKSIENCDKTLSNNFNVQSENLPVPPVVVKEEPMDIEEMPLIDFPSSSLNIKIEEAPPVADNSSTVKKSKRSKKAPRPFSPDMNIASLAMKKELKTVEDMKEEVSSSFMMTPRGKSFSLETVAIPFTMGWSRELVHRANQECKSGKKMSDVYYFGPDGKKLRSMPEVLAYLSKHNIKDLSNANFTFSKNLIYREPFEIERDAKQKSAFAPSTKSNSSAIKISVSPKKKATTKPVKSQSVIMSESASPVPKSENTPKKKSVSKAKKLPILPSLEITPITSKDESKKPVVKRGRQTSVDNAGSDKHLSPAQMKPKLADKPKSAKKTCKRACDNIPEKKSPTRKSNRLSTASIESGLSESEDLSLVKRRKLSKSGTKQTLNKDSSKPGDVFLNSNCIAQNTASKKLIKVKFPFHKLAPLEFCSYHCNVSRNQKHIECTSCLRFFHESCIPTVPKEFPFICQTCGKAKIACYAELRNATSSSAGPFLYDDTKCPDFPEHTDQKVLEPFICLEEGSKHWVDLPSNWLDLQPDMANNTCEPPSFPFGQNNHLNNNFGSYGVKSNNSSPLVVSSPLLFSHLMRPVCPNAVMLPNIERPITPNTSVQNLSPLIPLASKPISISKSSYDNYLPVIASNPNVFSKQIIVRKLPPGFIIRTPTNCQVTPGVLPANPLMCNTTGAGIPLQSTISATSHIISDTYRMPMHPISSTMPSHTMSGFYRMPLQPATSPAISHIISGPYRIPLQSATSPQMISGSYRMSHQPTPSTYDPFRFPLQHKNTPTSSLFNDTYRTDMNSSIPSGIKDYTRKIGTATRLQSELPSQIKPSSLQPELNIVSPTINLNNFKEAKCFDLISKYLNVYGLMKASQINTFWKCLVEQKELWKQVSFRGLRITDWDKCCHTLQKHRTKTLDLCDVIVDDINDPWKGFKTIIMKLSGIRDLVIDKVPPSLLYLIATYMSQLHKLECFLTSVLSEPEIWSTPCELEISRLRSLSKLSTLQIGSLGGIILKDMSMYQMPYLPNLRYLSLTGFKFNSVKNLEVLSQNQNLVSLELGHCYDIEPEIYGILKQLTNLEKLRLENGGSVDNTGLPEALLEMKHLIHLELMNYKIPHTLSDTLKQLMELIHLNVWPDNTSEGPLVNHNLFQAISSCKRLKYICWGIISEVEDANSQVLEMKSVEQAISTQLTFKELFDKLVEFSSGKVEVKCVHRSTWKEFCYARK